MRKIIQNKFLWHLFSFTFIAVYQHLLLFLIALPTQVAYSALELGVLTAVKSGPGAGFEAWNHYDSLATGLVLFFLLMETIADQQQWEFQTKKYELLKSKTLNQLPVPYRYGFLTKVCN